jgi:hypothetical protein
MYYESNMSENTYLLEDHSDNDNDNSIININNNSRTLNSPSWRQNINDIENAVELLANFNNSRAESPENLFNINSPEIITRNNSQLSFHSPTNSHSAISIQSNLSHMSQCFVCFENEVNGNLPIKLEDIDSISRQCECRGNIHMECFKKWVNRHQSCPVCRTPYSGNIIIIRTNSGNMRICISIFVSFVISALFLYIYNHH